ncbi:O-antigen ligase family protein [Nodosilinea sp. P-1105]|nr:O-antigen ligase family protein [Nodosilinea sp. P-1105]
MVSNLEYILSITIVVYLSGTLRTLLPDSLLSLIQHGTYVLFFLLLLARPKLSFACLLSNKVLLILVSLPIISSFWSEMPLASLKSGIIVVQTASVGFFLSYRYTLKEQIKIFAIAATIIGIINILYLVGYPDLAFHTDIEHSGALRGVYSQKNELAQVAVFSSLVFFVLNRNTSGKSRTITNIFSLTGFFLWMLLLFITDSKTGLLVFFFVLFIYTAAKVMRFRGYGFVLSVILGMLTITSLTLILFSNADEKIGFLGRDLTLTGRTNIWNATISMISQRPLLGYGRDAFWNLNTSIPYQIGLSLDSRATYMPPHSHNGFIDLTAELGLIGLLIFLFILIQSFFIAVQTVQSSNNTEYLWLVSYITFFILYNLTESSILKHNSLLWVTFVMVACSCQFVKRKKYLERCAK